MSDQHIGAASYALGRAIALPLAKGEPFDAGEATASIIRAWLDSVVLTADALRDIHFMLNDQPAHLVQADLEKWAEAIRVVQHG